jgi:hypothetical protein
MSDVCYPLKDRYFAGQDFLNIKLDTFIDLTAATVTEIHYTKPDGTRVERTATVVDNNDGDPTVLSYDFVVGENLTTDDGEWVFRTYVDFEGRGAYGAPVAKYFECLNQ